MSGYLYMDSVYSVMCLWSTHHYQYQWNISVNSEGLRNCFLVRVIAGSVDRRLKSACICQFNHLETISLFLKKCTLDTTYIVFNTLKLLSGLYCRGLIWSLTVVTRQFIAVQYMFIRFNIEIDIIPNLFTYFYIHMARKNITIPFISLLMVL